MLLITCYHHLLIMLQARARVFNMHVYEFRICLTKYTTLIEVTLIFLSSAMVGECRSHTHTHVFLFQLYYIIIVNGKTSIKYKLLNFIDNIDRYIDIAG